MCPGPRRLALFRDNRSRLSGCPDRLYHRFIHARRPGLDNSIHRQLGRLDPGVQNRPGSVLRERTRILQLFDRHVPDRLRRQLGRSHSPWRGKITALRRPDVRRTGHDILLDKYLLLDVIPPDVDYRRCGRIKGIAIDNRNTVVNMYVLIDIGYINLIDVYFPRVDTMPAVMAAAVVGLARRQRHPRHIFRSPDPAHESGTPEDLAP